MIERWRYRAMKIQFTVRLDQEIYNKVRMIAKQQHRSFSNLVECFVISGVQEYERDYGEVPDFDEE